MWVRTGEYRLTDGALQGRDVSLLAGCAIEQIFAGNAVSIKCSTTVEVAGISSGIKGEASLAHCAYSRREAISTVAIANGTAPSALQLIPIDTG